ncbi:VWA domain-containing protein [Motiliproteus coralliicola]|uniref:VWA domain-containing protein n=1 Tax=Motiliproteus coralliicola TaxID=2283196 RepID=A0A369WRU1_9GAMM|nr:VWA domain-containing protein [Motiliproteus coralliicola]RDE24392.1 VWA domain-containing protein [Motiliproteus coralliicola]
MLIENPWALLLAPLPLLVRWLSPRLVLPELALWVPFLAPLAEAAGERPDVDPVARRTLSQRLILVALWLLILAALCRPQWLGEPIREPLLIRDTLVAVDISGSMETADMRAASGGLETRLAAVKQLLTQLIHERQGDRFGLILFGSAPYLQAPFTRDAVLFEQLLAEAEVGMAGPKTMLGDAIGLAIKHFEYSGERQRVLLLVTDGNDSGSRMPPLEAARIAAAEGVKIHTLAVGDPDTEGDRALDLDALAAISATTDAKLIQASTADQLNGVRQLLARLHPSGKAEQQHRPRQELYPWPLAAALLLMLISQTWLYRINRRATHGH